MIDLISEYCEFRDFRYERLDGRVRGTERQKAIDRFESEEDSFLFFSQLAPVVWGSILPRPTSALFLIVIGILRMTFRLRLDATVLVRCNQSVSQSVLVVS